LPLILALSGNHNSGKTTLGTYLVERLVHEGFKVAVVKSTKEEGLLTEKEGTDTWRYSEASAEPVALFQKGLLTLYIRELPEEKEALIDSLKRLFWDRDLLLLEGFKSFPSISKIWVLKEGEREEEVLKSYPSIELIVRPEEKERALEFVKKKLKEEGSKEEVSLFVDGKEIYLKPFIKTILQGVIFGFLKGLKGIPEEFSYLEVKIKRK